VIEYEPLTVWLEMLRTSPPPPPPPMREPPPPPPATSKASTTVTPEGTDQLQVPTPENSMIVLVPERDVIGVQVGVVGVVYFRITTPLPPAPPSVRVPEVENEPVPHAEPPPPPPPRPSTPENPDVNAPLVSVEPLPPPAAP
jgi:hypothetical protein